jgi:acetolactate synthase small subunit
MKACDVVIDNSNSPEQLARQADKLLSRVRVLRLQEEKALAARLTALWT